MYKPLYTVIKVTVEVLIMSFSHILNQLLIAPLQLIYEFVYYYAKLFTNSTGMAIIFLGLVINLLHLPLYRQADAIQDAERAKEKQMEHWVRHIKKPSPATNAL